MSLLQRIITVQKEATSEPIKLQKLNLTGCWLKDAGIADLLPLIVSDFKHLETLIVSANRLTEFSELTFCKFLDSQFPEGRRLTIELRL